MTQLPEDKLYFDIDASVVYQLGESLITDVTQAIVELVKNAYDADATYASVTIETRKAVGEESAYPSSIGYVVIEDDGVGMNRSTIQDGWLTISKSPKREFKRQNKTTEKKRTPLGDKGLGRLGSQRLGHNLEIFTRPDGSDTEYHVSFTWKDFTGTKTLSQVPVRDEQVKPPQRKKGTKLIISDLRDPQSFSGEAAISKLEVELSRMISPYQKVKGFKVIASVNGRSLNLAEITLQIRQAAQLHYDIDFDGEWFSIKGKARFNYVKEDVDESGPQLSLLDTESDRDEFFQFFTRSKKAEQYNFRLSKEEGWFVEYEVRRKFNNFDSLELALDSEGFANPGPFRGEVDYFNLRNTGKQNVFTNVAQYRNYIKGLSGIRVYRDGFGVRVEHDWLKLSKQQTSGSSFYGLRPENTLGYIAISAKDNARLEETTDRQDLMITPYYENFYELLQYFVGFSRGAQEILRREWLKFEKKKKIEGGILDEEDNNPEKQLRKAQEHLSQASAQKDALNSVRRSLKQTVQETRKVFERLETSVPKDSSEYKDVQAIKNIIEERIGEEAQKPLSQMDEYLSNSLQSQRSTEKVADQIEILRDQIRQVYEMVSLGLTAETLSHEISQVMLRLASRTKDISRYLKDQKIRDAKLIEFIESVNTSVSSLNKQLSHLAPSLRYVREKKDKVTLSAFFKETKEYYKNRFENREEYDESHPKSQRIRVDIQERDKSFSILMNKGKLTQVIDNLFLNSEYWVREDLRLGYINEGIITVELLKPFVRISDNTRGIDPTVESSLFEAFVTTKGKQKGRGLGLFIVQELLQSDGCSIVLLPERNKEGRRFIFEIDFTGVLVGDV